MRLLATFLSLSFLLSALPLHASQLRRLNLDEMTRRADRVFSGRCVNVRVVKDSRLGREVTLVTFAVGRSAKGNIPGRVTVKLLGDQDAAGGGRGAVEGLPLFTKGEETLLFLYPDSDLGLTSPVGFGQGKFSLSRNKQGGIRALNAFGNDGLVDRLDPETKSRLGPGLLRLRSEEGVPPDLLLDIVEKLTGRGRGGAR